MTTLFIADPVFLEHETSAGHPERPDRLRALDVAFRSEVFSGLLRESAPMGFDSDVLRVHPQAYIDRLEASAPQAGLAHLDADTMMSPGTLEAIYRATGAAVRAVDAVMTDECQNAFVASRPPGHHAETATAMGFCFFNFAAIAARRAQALHGARRVAIVDWDVHHGNGTEEIFWSDPSVLYCSTHQSPLYPGTGAASDTGAHGTIVNVPLREGAGSQAFRHAFERTILPRIDAFAPDLIIVSAGFDAHNRDPLGGLLLSEEDFAWATTALMTLARKHCGGRIVSILEGGYDLKGLCLSACAHVQALMA